MYYWGLNVAMRIIKAATTPGSAISPRQLPAPVTVTVTQMRPRPINGRSVTSCGPVWDSSKSLVNIPFNRGLERTWKGKLVILQLRRHDVLFY